MSVSSLYSNDVTSLHFAIKRGNINEIKLLLSKLPVDKHYFDIKNNSAAAIAIKWERHDIYELLVARGIFLGPHEWMDEATSGQDRSRKVKLREIHRKYFNDPNLKHLVNLIASTKLSHEASPSDRREHLRLITEAFEDLNGLKSIEPILKVASTSPKLRIVFDFNRDSVEFLDPVKTRNVMGTSYTENFIVYVGAKDLKKKENRSEVLGVLIHELTHFVMKLVYGNEAKPYHLEDQEKFNEFSQVVVDTETKKESEPYIEGVYDNYPVIRHHAELIVRVPQLTALYKDDEDKTIEVQDGFSKLFDFYEENTLVDLKRLFPLMEVKHEIREFNELCGILAILEKSDIEMSPQALNDLDLNSLSNDKILFSSSNCPQLTLSAIFQKARTESNFETSFIFADIKSMINDKIFGLAVKALKLFTKPRMIIDCQSVVKFVEVMGIVKKLNDNKTSQRVTFIIDKIFEDSCIAEPFKVMHSFNHLASTFQQKLIQKKIEFLGSEMVMGEMVNDLQSIKSIPLQELLDDETFVVGQNLKFETEKLIERKFLPPNSKIKPFTTKTLESGGSFGDYTIEHDLDELLIFTKDRQTILISDEPGMGKSTSFKMLHSKLKQKNPSLWLVFMDLKDHFKAYQVSCLGVRSREDIAKFFTEKVLIIRSFEAEIFTQLYNEDRVVFLMDGLDEICPSHKQFIFSLMKDIRKFSKNQLWISTRPHLVDELKTELNPIEFALKPFTRANRREFFEKHFIGDLNFELILKEIERFLEKLDDDVCNPLVMRIIVEILDEDRNLKLSEANLFVLYDRFTRKMIEKSQEKGSEAEKDIVNWVGNSNLVNFFQQQAFLTCFGGECYSVLRKKLIDPQFDHVQKPPLDEIARIGLMFASSPENLHFIHRTFAEFYVAKFFYEVIFKFRNLRAEKHLYATIEFLIKNVLESDNFDFIKVLLDNAIDNDKELTVKKFPPLTVKLVKENMDRRHFLYFAKNGNYNLIELFALHLYPDAQKLLFSSESPNLVMVTVETQSVNFLKRFLDLLKRLNTDKLEKMLFEQVEYDRNVLHLANMNKNSEVFEYLINFCESFMTSEKLNKLLMQTFKLKVGVIFSQTNILHNAIENDSNVDIILKVLTQKLSPAQRKTMLLGVTYPDGSNLLHFAFEYQKSIENCERLFAFIREASNTQYIENFLLHKNEDGLKAFDIALFNANELSFGIIRKFCLEVLRKDKKLINIFGRNKSENWIQFFLFGKKLKDWFQESSLHFRQLYRYYQASYWDGVFKRFIYFIMELFANSIQKEFFLVKEDDGETFLDFAIESLGEDDFAFLLHLQKNVEDRVEILQQINSRGECAFHSAAKLDGLEKFRMFRRLYEESVNKETLRQMIVSCDKSWIFNLVRSPKTKTFSELCQWLSELFNDTHETEKLKPFFQFADETGQTAFMAAAKVKNKIEPLFALAKELYDLETVKEFLLLKDADGETAFTYLITSGEDTTIEFMECFLQESFWREKMQELFMTKVQYENILCRIIGHRLFSPERFEILCNFFIKLFDGEAQKLKDLFFAVDLGRTVLMKAAEQSNYNYFEVLVEVMEKVFVEEDIVEMLCQTNLEGKTAFHFAMGNKKEEIFETVNNFYFETLKSKAMSNIILAIYYWTRDNIIER